jgi:lipid-binding SYLF domain-containing protein
MVRKLCALAMVVVPVFAFGCTSTPKPDTQTDREVLMLDTRDTIEEFKRVDPSMQERFENARAYAVFPEVGKGAVGVGGAYGRGMLFENGDAIGYCDLSQATIGFQLGGQTYREVIFFQNDMSLRSFKSNTLEFAAQASAVAASAGASADADYENGVLVFTMARGGLMFEASIGGQRFRFDPLPEND